MKQNTSIRHAACNNRPHVLDLQDDEVRIWVRCGQLLPSIYTRRPSPDTYPAGSLAVPCQSFRRSQNEAAWSIPEYILLSLRI
ncbi:hypothetical protein CVT26_001808 [Gymnopilus dilepis]|uniref:Uncharacterized protein n=1 Tax=Gymnopilus dilepis TaxID=231916 RepID=A0A409Y438_9AGAR|nr:hypothetical protein CVT26_001808 [Gymnopilus dilepis]